MPTRFIERHGTPAAPEQTIGYIVLPEELTREEWEARYMPKDDPPGDPNDIDYPIEYNKIDFALGKRLTHLQSVGSNVHTEPVLVQEPRDQVAELAVVIDDKNVLLGFHGLLRDPSI